MKKILLAASILLLAAPASAQVIVVGTGQAQSCYKHAKSGNSGTKGAIAICTEALEGTALKRDIAATHVNRGVLLMRKGDYTAAETDYIAALDIRPVLPEAHINHGVALYHQQRLPEALSAFNRALEMEMDDKHAAMTLYNRGLAYEMLKDAPAAYRDYKAAIELKPDWELPGEALQRFTVTRSTS